MHPLDSLIGQYVVPVMKAAGFRRKGRAFRLAAPGGDHLFLHFHRHAVDPDRYVFDVVFSIVPLSNWEFLNRYEVELPAPDASGALAVYSVMPPAEAAQAPGEDMPFRSRWAFIEPDTRDPCGRQLAQELTEEALPRGLRLTNRGELLKELRTAPSDELLACRGEPMREILLRIDDGPVAALAALVDKAETEGVFPPFVGWARERLARRATQG